MSPFQERAKRPTSAMAGPYGHPFHPMLVTGSAATTRAFPQASSHSLASRS